MLRSVKIVGYRGLADFSMEKLGRINLLVGTNNAGKTSALEAITLLESESAYAFYEPLRFRGEFVEQGRHASPNDQEQVELSHLFGGHRLSSGVGFTISGITDSNDKHTVTAKITNAKRPFLLDVNWREQGPSTRIALSPKDGLTLENVERTEQGRPPGRTFPVRILLTTSLDAESVSTTLSDVALTEDEKFVVEAMQTIDRTIEKIAPQSLILRAGSVVSRGGVKVKLSTMSGPIPIGSLGEGVWRLLGIALALVTTKGGTLLVDDIDVGLHHSVMARMWKLVLDTARRHSVQVFATSHSRDCYESLAEIVTRQPLDAPEVTIQRIENGQPMAIAFTDHEIAVAAERHIEVR